MAQTLYFTNTANDLTLSNPVGPTDTTLLVTPVPSGWSSSFPCKGILELGTSNGEIVKITGISGSSFTVVRGQDGTSGVSHAAGATLVHGWGAAEATEANLHANSSSDVHGATGSVVGTTGAQTLTNKTLTSPNLDTAVARGSSSAPAIDARAGSSGTANIVQWSNSSGVQLSRIGHVGDLLINPSDPAAIPITVKMAASQTASGVEVKDSAGTVRLLVDKEGKLLIGPPASDTSTPNILIKDGGSAGPAIKIADSSGTLLASWGRLGNIGATEISLTGFFADNPISYPNDGSKFKVDSNGRMSAANYGPSGQIRQATTATTLTDNVAAALAFDTHDYDTHSFHSTSTNPTRITPTVAGWYTFSGGVGFQNVSGSTERILEWRKNGTAVNGGQTYYLSPASFPFTFPARTCKIFCNGTTDYVELWVTQHSGGNLLTQLTGGKQSSVTWDLASN